MAIINPSGLYSENQGIFNSTPFTQFAIQQEAKKQAKDEALDKYYNDLPKSINSAGMRTIDYGGYMDKINGIRQFYQQNKDKIKNPRLDNGKAQAEYQGRNTDASMFVNESKKATEEILPFNKVLGNPETRSRVMESDIAKADSHNLPLNDKHRVPFNSATVDFNPKELTPSELENYRKSLQGDFVPTEVPIKTEYDPKNLTVSTTYRKKWDDNQLKNIGDKAIASTQLTRKIEFTADQAWKKLNTLPPTLRDQAYNQYNDIYKKYYGKNIEHPDELHAAMMIGNTIGESERTEVKPDTMELYKMKRADRLEDAAYLARLRDKLIRGRQKATPFGTMVNDGNLLEGIGVIQPEEFTIRSGFYGLGGLYGKPAEKGKIIDGFAYNSNGTPYSGVVTLNPEQINTALPAVLIKAGKLNGNQTEYKFVYKDGVNHGLMTERGQIDRIGVEDAQKNYDKTPQKADRQQFITPKVALKPKPTSKPTSKTPPFKM